MEVATMNTAKHVLIIGLLSLSTTALAAPVKEGSCDVYLRAQHKFVPVPGLHVLDAGDGSAALKIPGIDPAKVGGVQCVRSTIVPQAGDASVLKAGWPFYISVTRPDGSKVLGVLEIAGGHYRLRLVEGTYRGDESKAVVSALDAMAESAKQAGTSSP
jgi:hypothetical protein